MLERIKECKTLKTFYRNIYSVLQENSWSIIAMYRCINLRNRRNSNDIKNRVNYPGKASLLKGPVIIRNVLVLLFVGGRRLCY